jgi:hypothetical protein
MFKIKEIIDGLIETMLDLPIMFLRSHALILFRGPLGLSLLARRISHSDARYLRPRTIAFLEIVILYVFSRAMDTNVGTQGIAPFANSMFVEFFKLSDAHLYDRQFVSLLALFFSFYYCYYILVRLLKFKEPSRTVLTDGCLYYSTLCLFLAAGFIFVFLGAMNAAFSSTNELIMRTALLAVYVFSFGQLGLLFAAHLKRKCKTLRYLFAAVAGGLSFAVFAAIMWASLGKSGVWPDLLI